MFTHIFYIQKLCAFKRGRYNFVEETIEIRAKDLYEARKQVERDYPDWSVSMCWPKLEWTSDRKHLIAV